MKKATDFFNYLRGNQPPLRKNTGKRRSGGGLKQGPTVVQGVSVDQPAPVSDTSSAGRRKRTCLPAQESKVATAYALPPNAKQVPVARAEVCSPAASAAAAAATTGGYVPLPNAKQVPVARAEVCSPAASGGAYVNMPVCYHASKTPPRSPSKNGKEDSPATKLQKETADLSWQLAKLQEKTEALDACRVTFALRRRREAEEALKKGVRIYGNKLGKGVREGAVSEEESQRLRAQVAVHFTPKVSQRQRAEAVAAAMRAPSRQAEKVSPVGVIEAAAALSARQYVAPPVGASVVGVFVKQPPATAASAASAASELSVRS